MDGILREHEDYAVWYIDDVLVMGNTKSEVERRANGILATLNLHGLEISVDKSHGPRQYTKFLGFIIGGNEITPDLDKETIMDWPLPQNAHEWQVFCGLANWYRDHVPQLAAALAPLYARTGADLTNDRRASVEFLHAKKALMKFQSTQRFNADVALSVITDASLFGIGAILVQEGRPIAIGSRGLSPAERNYTTTERELLAIVFAFKKWRHFFESTDMEILVHTDHMALTQELNADSSNRRLNRWQIELGQYPIKFVHVSGVHNPADYPSRRPDFDPNWEGEGGESDKDDSLDFDPFQ